MVICLTMNLSSPSGDRYSEKYRCTTVVQARLITTVIHPEPADGTGRGLGDYGSSGAHLVRSKKNTEENVE